MSEQQLIDRFFRRATNRGDVALGIGDDAALTRVGAGMQLVSAVDTIVESVHFPIGLAPQHIGYRALAVNLSDLAAMGATAHWALLSVSCPDSGSGWFEALAAGFFRLADQYDVALIGGDLVRGPLSITVTVLGQVPADTALLRSGAVPGDLLYVTGAPGLAAAGLESMLGRRESDLELEHFFLEPKPRLEQGQALRAMASAAIDISDGLVGDARHLATASGVAIQIDPDAVVAIAGADLGLALSGGDDYELCFTLAPEHCATLAKLAQTWSCPVTRIGVVTAGSGVTVCGLSAEQFFSYDHFA